MRAHCGAVAGIRTILVGYADLQPSGVEGLRASGRSGCERSEVERSTRCPAGAGAQSLRLLRAMRMRGAQRRGERVSL